MRWVIIIIIMIAVIITLIIFDNNCDHCNNHDHNYDGICVDIFQLLRCHHRCYAVMQTSLLLQRRQPPLEVIIIINMNFCDDKNTFAGTTLILAILDEGQLWVANVGDSRGVFGNRWLAIHHLDLMDMNRLSTFDGDEEDWRKNFGLPPFQRQGNIQTVSVFTLYWTWTLSPWLQFSVCPDLVM